MLLIASVLAEKLAIPQSLRSGRFHLNIPKLRAILNGNLDEFKKKPSSKAFANLADQFHVVENQLMDYVIIDTVPARAVDVDITKADWLQYVEEFHRYLIELLNGVPMFSNTQLSPAQMDALLREVTTGPIRFTTEATKEIRMLMNKSPQNMRDLLAKKENFFLTGNRLFIWTKALIILLKYWHSS